MTPKLLTPAWMRNVIPRRPTASHKGSNGHVLLVAGSRGMAGAAVLSGLGALRAGAGLLTVGIIDRERRTITSRLPEAMTLPLPEAKGGYLAIGAAGILRSYVRRRTITTLAAGPGLSVHPSIRQVMKALLRTGLPFVVDADGLNCLHPKDLQGRPVVITPHPGEFSTLMGFSRDKIQKDRCGMAASAAKRLGIVCVLKGHHTVISDGHHTYVNPTGNSAMATGGMGDVLTGVISGFLAQGLSLFEAACAGVYLHGLAGDIAAKSDRGLLASELAAHIPSAIEKILMGKKNAK